MTSEEKKELDRLCLSAENKFFAFLHDNSPLRCKEASLASNKAFAYALTVTKNDYRSAEVKRAANLIDFCHMVECIHESYKRLYEEYESIKLQLQAAKSQLENVNN